MTSLRRAGVGIWLAVALTSFCTLTAGGSMTSRDPVVAYDVTRNLVQHGSITVSESLMSIESYRGRDGHYYSPFGIAQSIWNVPFYLAGRMVERLGFSAGGTETVPKAAVALGTVPAVSLLAWVCFELLLVLGVRDRRALWIAALTIVATPLWPYSGFGFNQPLSGLFVWMSILAAVSAKGRPHLWFLSAFAAGVAMLTRHEMALSAAIVGCYVTISAAPAHRRNAALAYGAGFAIPLAIWGGLNWWRFGNFLDSGYLHDSTPGYGSSVVDGTLGLLFSPYASLWLYCPIAIAAVPAWMAMRRERPSAAWLFLAIFMSLFGLYASLGNWMGGRSYGPRYLVPVLPALTLPLAFWNPGRLARRLTVGLAVVSVLVQVPGVVVDYAKVRVERARAGETVAQDPRWSGCALLLNTRATLTLVPNALRQFAGLEPRPAIDPQASELSDALSVSPDFWWLYLWYLNRLNRVAALGIAAILAVGAVAAFARAYRLTSADRGSVWSL